MSTFVPSKPSERAKSDSTQDHDLNNKESTHRLVLHNEESCCRNRQPWTLQRQTQENATAATAGYEGRRNVWRDTGTSYEKHIQETGPVCSFRTCQLVPQRTKLYLHWFKKESDTTAS